MDTDLSTTILKRRETLDRVRMILVRDLGIRRELGEIDPDTPLFGTGLGLDSVDAVELVVAAETEFGLRVPDGPIARTGMRTVNTLVDLLLDLSVGDENG